jgi:purine-cytosine permease-like protein
VVRVSAEPDPVVRPREEFVHDLDELAADLEFERAVVEEAVSHDYSTSTSGIVPLNRRRPMWHFAALELTFEAGFGFLLLGFTIHDGGFRLAPTLGILALSSAIYIAYATVGGFIGSRTGQTHSLLTRSIFGVVGSWIVSALTAISLLGWVGFQANFTAQIWDGLYGWGHILVIGLVLAAVMVINNVLGFTGISVFARYLVTPFFVAWILYTVVKGLTEGGGVLGATPKATAPMSFLAAVGLSIGFYVWGNEPDIWRFGKPKFAWPIPPYIFAFVFGPVLFGVGGWIMAEVSTNHGFAASLKSVTHYSLFGALWLTFIISVLGQVSINDGNYYAAINAGQNIIGGWKRWKRVYTCIVMAGLGVLAAYIIPYVITNGFEKLAAFISVTLPCATIIMAVDHFVLPRVVRISRPLTRVPAWSETALFNWPGIVALIISVTFGAYATGLFSFLGEDATTYWGLPAAETWVLAVVSYVAAAYVAKVAAGRNVRRVMGFPSYLLHAEIPEDRAIDPASELEAPAPATAAAAQAPVTA